MYNENMKRHYFYIFHLFIFRTIPSDELQSEGIIILCEEFGWDSIAVVYVNDVYGLYLSLGIQRLGKDKDIDVSTIAVAYEDTDTYEEAADQILKLGVYIVVLIVHNTEVGIQSLFQKFDELGIVGYPYYYIGLLQILQCLCFQLEFMNS